ncbi:MAG: hypothetical protein EXS31_14045 [Pedosphaera sp.]|nr:hypothetical protein [Pedosphaera sp.]
MNRRLIFRVSGAMALAICIPALRAGPIPVPNGSFESPVSIFIDINFDAWQKTARPDFYAEGGGFLWSQLTGAFKNPAPGTTGHIDNCVGNQAVWLFAVSEVGLFQDYESVDWNDAAPTHALDARFETGSSYELAVGVIGGGGGMSPGATLDLSLYYRDAASNRVAVATTSITNSPSVFTNQTHFIEFRVRVPSVKPNDAWAGQHIGVQFLSTVSTNLQGGYWDLDDIRLSSMLPTFLTGLMAANGQFTFTLESEPGSRVEILTSADATLPAANWSSLGITTNLTGSVPFTDPLADLSHRFYQARQLP